MSGLLAGYSDSSSSDEETDKVSETKPVTNTKSKPLILSRLNLSKRDRARFESEHVKDVSAEELRGQDWQEKLLEDLRSRPSQPVAQPAQPAQTPQDTSKVKKHHVNWLAEEARQKEMQILERNAAGRSKQRDTRQKYGW